MDWEKLFLKEIQAPHIPQVKHAGDTSNFDVYEEDPEPYGRVQYDPYADKFAGF
jgi:protein kinase A